MNEQINSQSQVNCVMEAYYAYIAEAHIQNIAKHSKMQQEEINQMNESVRLNEWFQKYNIEKKQLDSKQKRKQQFKQIRIKVAMIAMILFTSLFVITVSVEAVRVKVLNLLLEENDKYTTIAIQEEPLNQETVGKKDQYYPAYIPAGFSLEKTEELNETKMITFKDNEDNEILFVRTSLGSEAQIDTENAKTSHVKIGGNKGFLSEKEDGNILMWYNDEAMFYIIAPIEANEIIKMAENIK